MNATQLVNDMYIKLEDKFGIKAPVKVLSEFTCEDVAVVRCLEQVEGIPDYEFDLVVLDDGTILNDDGGDVYKILVEAMTSRSEARVVASSEGGTKYTLFEDTEVACEAYCKANRYIWLDDNCFEWGLSVELLSGGEPN